jgi:hemerythrin superfamily protein
VPQDAVALITRDHRELEQLFERLRNEPEHRAGLLNMVGPLLVAHSRAEEEHVYPKLAEARPEEKGEVHHGKEEHEEAEKLLAALQQADPDSPEFTQRLEKFVDAVTHHVEEEENKILPALREAVSKDRLGELGYAFAERRAQVMAEEYARGGQGARRAKEIAREIGDE